MFVTVDSSDTLRPLSLQPLWLDWWNECGGSQLSDQELLRPELLYLVKMGYGSLRLYVPLHLYTMAFQSIEKETSVPFHDFLMKLKRILEKRSLRQSKLFLGSAASESAPALLAVP